MHVNRNPSNVDNIFWEPSKELAKGMLFNSREAVKTACKIYSMKVGRQFQSSETKRNTITLVCKLNCNWRLRATEKKASGLWQITRYDGPHTCSAPGQSQDNRNFDSEFISGYIQAMLQEQPDIKVKTLIAGLKERFGITPTYKKVWHAKQKAISNLWGDWDESYQLLCHFMHATVSANHDSFWDHKGEAHLINHCLVEGVRQFKRMFIAYKPCIDGFKYCKLVLYVDGTMLNVPVKEGSSVSATSMFSDGTTICTVADMSDVLFKGHIDETEVARLRVGMETTLVLGAMQEVKVPATLEYISPEGVEQNGVTKFEVWAAASIPDGVDIRSGYSVNARVVTEEHKDVLSIDEASVVFDADSAFVYRLTSRPEDLSSQEWERIPVKVGISNGIYVEILQGVNAEDHLRGIKK